jgi:8-oxo-dGTP pyrophosphatase MutT (NUDIX family)
MVIALQSLLMALSPDTIRAALGSRQPATFPGINGMKQSAVALVLRENTHGLDILFIVRADCSKDPWSGNIGFPGGGMEEEDSSLQATAERETREELALDLSTAACLGRLDDLVGANLPVLVSCFVYMTRHTAPFTLSPEVSKAFWFPVAALREPERHVMTDVTFGDKVFVRPALRILASHEPVLWGITYRLVEQLLALLDHPLPDIAPFRESTKK